MKLSYLTHMRLPTEKAYGLQMVNTAYHLAQEGVHVELIGTRIPNLITTDVFSYYDLPKDAFVYHVVPSLRLLRNTRLGFWINMLSFSVTASYRVCMSRADFVYSREPFPLMFLSWLGKRTCYEMHDFPDRHHWFHRLLCSSARVVAVTNPWAYSQVISRYHINPNKVILVPNGFDEKRFTGLLTQSEARERTGLLRDGRIVLYSGHLYDWKGVRVIIDVARLLPDVLFVFLGGSAEDQERLKTDAGSNVRFLGHRPPGEVPPYLAAADILVLPNIPIVRHSEFSTSPIKLFEYMASRRPVIASRLPSITGLVTGDDVVFAPPGDVSAWAEAIRATLAGGDEIAAMVERAAVTARQFTWSSKAKKLIATLSLG